MTAVVHGMSPLEGETAFAFLVVRLRDTVDRDGLVRVLRYFAPLVPDVEGFIAELPEPLDERMRLVGMPWLPPEAGHATGAQRRLAEQADAVGIEELWFFQTGTSLVDDDDDDDGDDPRGKRASSVTDEHERPRRATSVTGEHERPTRAMTATDEITTTTTLPALRDADRDDDDDDEVVSGEIGGDVSRDDDSLDEDLEDADHRAPGDADEMWTQGPPPQVSSARFPVDGYPAILDELDWEDFGIAFKLAGPHTPGEGTVLIGFHTLWLAPYGGRYRNAAVTVDRERHAAHLWVDRFSVPCSPEEQVHHLLWIVSKLDEVIPVVHARFGGASLLQKLDDDTPFVLGGNPVLRIFAEGGEGAVEAWLAEQTEWTPRELGAQLRELAIEVASPTGHDEHDDDEHEDDELGEGEEVDAEFDDDGREEAEIDEDDEGDDHDDSDDDDSDDEEDDDD